MQTHVPLAFLTHSFLHAEECTQHLLVPFPLIPPFPLILLCNLSFLLPTFTITVCIAPLSLLSHAFHLKSPPPSLPHPRQSSSTPQASFRGADPYRPRHRCLRRSLEARSLQQRQRLLRNLSTHLAFPSPLSHQLLTSLLLYTPPRSRPPQHHHADHAAPDGSFPPLRLRRRDGDGPAGRARRREDRHRGRRREGRAVHELRAACGAEYQSVGRGAHARGGGVEAQRRE